MKSFKGMTLLELLISLGIFSFMAVFMTQLVRQSRRQAQKIKQDVHQNSSFDNVIDLIKKDFSSTGFFLDLNDNFRQNFPVKQNLNESKSRALLNSSDKNPSSSKNRPVFMSPYFVFEGKEDEVEFVSYSLTEDSQNEGLKQWIQIRYFIQDCAALDNSTASSCLMRSSKRSWSLGEDRPAEEILVLFRDFKSLRFSYLTGKNLLGQEWEDSWELEKSLSFSGSSVRFPQELTFPFRVKLEITAQEKKFVWDFNVANSYLNSWNPFSKEFFNFTKWEQPKKKTAVNKPARFGK